MLEPRDFFDLEGYDHRTLFAECEFVWNALDRLKDYLAACFQDAWPLAGITGQIERALVIHDGQIRESLEIRPTGPKGTVQAFSNGEVLEGAAVVLPGAYLFDDRIILGPGSVVEPGALIKGPAVIGRDGKHHHSCAINVDTHKPGTILVIPNQVHVRSEFVTVQKDPHEYRHNNSPDHLSR